MVSPDLPSLLQYGIKNLTIRRGDTPLSAATSKNHWIRHQYGAWYLPVDLWRYKNSVDGLSDPQEDTMKTVSEAKLKSRELDSTLASMHGAMSFRWAFYSAPMLLLHYAPLQGYYDNIV